ncbi:MAG: nucleotidyl transferase AbiEii/AbiGii toxin family protein [candidate division WOR-3 bacterium]
MEILTPLQQDFIRAFSKTKLVENFFLTGGTALSAFYLFHRYSEDMDFFTEIEGEVIKVVPILKKLLM